MDSITPCVTVNEFARTADVISAGQRPEPGHVWDFSIEKKKKNIHSLRENCVTPLKHPASNVHTIHNM